MNNIKLCGNCHTENSFQSKFCSKCGAKFLEQQPVQQPNDINEQLKSIQKTALDKFEHTKQNVSEQIPVVKEKVQAVTKNINISKKTWMISGASVAAVALIVVVLAIVLTNKSNIINGLNKAAETGDVSAIMDVLELDAFSEQETAAFESLLAEGDLSNVHSSIESAIEDMEEYDYNNTTVYIASDTAAVQINSTKKLGLFTNYEIIPETTSVYTYSNLDGITVELAGSEYSPVTQEEVWPETILPGKYTYTINYKSDLGEFMEERSLTATINDYNQLDVAVGLNEINLQTTNYPEMEYYVDDKKVDITSMVENDIFYFPNLLHFDFHAQFKEDDVVYKSDVIKMPEDGIASVVFPKYDSMLEEQSAAFIEEELMYTNVRLLLQAYMNIYTANIPSRLSETVHESSPFLKSQMKYMEKLSEDGTVVAIEKIDLKEANKLSDTKIEAVAIEEYLVSTASEKNKPVKQTSTYTIEIIDGTYYITDLKVGK